MTDLEHDVTLDAARRAVLVLPIIGEDMPPVAREGIARRRLVATTGRCPCGATMTLPPRAERRAARRRGDVRVTRVRVEHEDDCPAIAPELDRHTRGGAR